ncbi:MAG: hypothetical protein J0L81_13420 [Caulobacterales bacterium]|nr:hypothetical protein [Caulobacterales bacterium]
MEENESGLGMLAGLLAGALILVLTAMALLPFQPSEAFEIISISVPAALPEQPIVPMQW